MKTYSENHLTIYIPQEIKIEAKDKGINISQICREAILTALGKGKVKDEWRWG